MKLSIALFAASEPSRRTSGFVGADPVATFIVTTAVFVIEPPARGRYADKSAAIETGWNVVPSEISRSPFSSLAAPEEIFACHDTDGVVHALVAPVTLTVPNEPAGGIVLGAVLLIS